MPSPAEKVTLPNGVRVVFEPVTHVQSVAIGIWCQTGSRLETEKEAGISHLIEHMLFKGTASRSAERIAQEIEGRGGHLNAFTDREVTCYYARVLSADLGIALEVLADMFVNSKLDHADLDLEKGVVQEEIKKYEDSPEDHIHDLHAQSRWGDHPLGRPVIGTHDSVGSFTPDHLRSYMKRRYAAGKTFVAAAGNLQPDELCGVAERFLNPLRSDFQLPNEAPPVGKPGEHYLAKDVEQVHFCIGGDAVSVYDERKYALSVLDAILGGSMSSRLFQEIREKRGLAYAIGSYAALYREGGSFTVYGGTSPRTYDDVRVLVQNELDKIREEPVPDEELERTKSMLKGNLVLGLEGMSSRMHRLARNEMIFGRDIPVEETVAKIESVTAEQVQSLASEFLAPPSLTVTAIGPDR
jgi:predicted Zn-dependent peptidase